MPDVQGLLSQLKFVLMMMMMDRHRTFLSMASHVLHSAYEALPPGPLGSPGAGLMSPTLGTGAVLPPWLTGPPPAQSCWLLGCPWGGSWPDWGVGENYNSLPSTPVVAPTSHSLLRTFEALSAPSFPGLRDGVEGDSRNGLPESS